MKIGLVVLSDIHFSASRETFSIERADLIAGAVSSDNVHLDRIVIILVGDIAHSGEATEYEIAKTFITKVKSALRRHYPALVADVIMIPGNHDCLLPEDEVQLRKTQVETSIQTFNKEKPDRAFVNQLLAVQDNFWQFAASHSETHSGDYSRLFSSRTIAFCGKRIQFNLYNSAALSQRHEKPSELYLPVRMLASDTQGPPDADVAISLVHHPLNWLEPNNHLAFRKHLLRTSDLVFTGHQHKNDSFTQAHETGETVRFFESPALFDTDEREPSGFRVVTFDLSSGTMKDCAFEWREDRYRPTRQYADWRALELNRAARPNFVLDPHFFEVLSDPGIGYLHQSDGRKVALSDIFVYPDLRPTGTQGGTRAVRGSELLIELSKPGIHLIQGDAFSGKTALARSLFHDFFSQDIQVPILIDGSELSSRGANQFEKRVKSALSREYEKADVDAYMQLPRAQRAVIIDDWHRAKISGEARIGIYKWLKDFAESTILTTDKLYEVSRIITSSVGMEDAPTEESLIRKYELLGLSHVSRGALIHRWLRLRRDADLESIKTSKESKATEDEVSRILGKDSLPPYAFFILCLLQARQNHKIERIAGGSFGHLFGVLVTSALARGNPDESDLSKKYALLSEIAAYLWINKRDWLSREEINHVAASFYKSYLVELTPDKLLPELQSCFVLKKTGDSYAFSYPRFFYYFVALYIKDRLDDAEDSKLADAIDYMIDNISSEMNSSVVMFLIFFAKEKRRIINRLTGNADKIYAELKPARLEDDAVPFFSRKEDPSVPLVPDEIDIAQNRENVRRKLDAGENPAPVLANHVEVESYPYADDLPDTRKLHLADRHLDALGQIIRNFSTTLPEKDKMKVLKCAYLLGLRSISRVLWLISQWTQATEALLDSRDQNTASEPDAPSLADLKKKLDELGLLTGKAAALVFIKKISSSVGVADMEEPYRRVIDILPGSYATNLTDVMIQMDHFREFPTSRIIELNRKMKSNPFAQGVLQWLVASYLLLFRVDRLARQRVSSELKLKDNLILKLSLNQ